MGWAPLLLQHAVLSGRVSPQGSLSASFTGIQAVLQIAHDIAGGMGYLHDRGVLHGVSGVCRGAHVLPPGRTAVGLSMRLLRGRFTCTVAACCCAHAAAPEVTGLALEQHEPAGC